MIHPGWDRSSKLNDILAGHDLSIITLKDEVDMYNIKTIPICLPDPGRDNFLTRTGRAADVTGFGLIVNPRTGGRKNPDFVQTASGTYNVKDIHSLILTNFSDSCRKVNMSGIMEYKW